MSAPLILGTNSIKDTGFDVANSYFIGADAKTSVTNTTPTNTKIFTISFWIKMHEFPTSSGDRPIFGYFSDSNNQAYMYLRNDGTLGIFENESGNTKIDIRTSQVLRDPGAFYNIIMAIDTSQGTAANRLKLYINGSQVSSFAAENYPAQDYASQWNENSLVFHVGGTATNDGNHVKGTFCEFAFIDGQQLDQTSFGEFDQDTPTVFKPIALSTLTFGNNGFLLEFKETGTSANSSGIGADTSGNNRHHSVTNITATDQRTDTCTNNFCTLDPNNASSNCSLADGNTEFGQSANDSGVTGNLGFTQGKWYWEFKVVGGLPEGGIILNPMVKSFAALSTVSGTVNNTTLFRIFNNTGATSNFRAMGSTVNTTVGASVTYAVGDIISVAVDADAGKIWFAKNGTYEGGGNPATGTSPTYDWSSNLSSIDHIVPGFLAGTGTSAKQQCNFGNPAFTISSSNTDSEGFGNFEYAVPSGYFALCTKNLSEYGG
jgi:hypothetical protein